MPERRLLRHVVLLFSRWTSGAPGRSSRHPVLSATPTSSVMPASI
jgi:hypothetical protein